MSEDKVEMAAIYRLHAEIMRTGGKQSKTVTVDKDDLMNALRMIEILQSEIRELVGEKRET